MEVVSGMLGRARSTSKVAERPTEEKVDVLICGSGSAGLACALWLAIYNHRFRTTSLGAQRNDSSEGNYESSTNRPITYRILESRDGPLQVGQADGVQCRTVEIYESFGLDHIIKNEGYWVNEVSFWAVDQADTATDGEGTAEPGRKKIVRTGRAADVQPGLSHQPHLILNQARINGLMLEKMKALNGQDVDYGWKAAEVEVNKDPGESHPVTVVSEKDGTKKSIKAKYVLAGDGAHSQIRRSLQIPMEGDNTNAVWGVMDVFPRTNFPDFRKKCTIHSEVGTLIIIPREGDTMIRMYFELPEGTNPKSVALEDLQKKARDIFWPYEMDFFATKWWSAYSIGQRVAKSMVDESGHIFLAGDACHTHSPKAGQGMNASLQDGYNIGWKLGALLMGQADQSILDTYIQERHQYAQQLIEFDRYWAKLFSSEPQEDGKKPTAEEFNQAFVKGGIFTAGMAANYQDSDLVANSISDQALAKKVIVGQRLPSAQVVRMSDSKPFPLLKLLRSDGRWRMLVFAGEVDDPTTLPSLKRLGEELSSTRGLLSKFTPAGMPADSILETLVVLRGDRKSVEFDQIHAAFKPNLPDMPIASLHKIFFDDESWNWGHDHAYETLGINPRVGCIIVARPDQYVSAVVRLRESAQLSEWFSRFMRPTNN